MKKTTLIIIMLTILSKIFGFARDITLSYFYGASNISDAYLVSLSIPLTVFAFIGVGITTSYIPIYNGIRNKDDINIADKYTNNLINFALIICTIMIVFSLIFTVPLVKLFALGFEGQTLKLTVLFTRISVIGIYFSCLVYIFSSYLQLNNNFVVPALIGIPLNIFTISSIILSARLNSTILSIGSVIGVISQLLLILPFVYKYGYKHKLILNLREDNLRKTMLLAVPAILGTSVDQINKLVDKTLASQIIVGGVSALNYANKLNLFIQGIFVTSIATVMYPIISKMATENNINGLKKSVSEAINIIILLIIPITIGAMIFVKPVIMLLFGRGVFDSHAITLTSSALFFYSIGMIGFGFREVISRVFYSLQDTKTPTLNASIGMIMNIGLNIVLSKYMGIGGLALATSISAIFTSLLLILSLRKKIGSFGMKQIFISFLKVVIASLIMGGFAKLSFNHLTLTMTQNISLIFSIGIGAIIYFVIIYFMKIEDVDTIINSLKQKFKKATA